MSPLRKRRPAYDAIPHSRTVIDERHQAREAEEAGYQAQARKQAEALMPSINRGLDMLRQGKVDDFKAGRHIHIYVWANGLAIKFYGPSFARRIEKELREPYRRKGYRISGAAPNDHPNSYVISVGPMGKRKG